MILLYIIDPDLFIPRILQEEMGLSWERCCDSTPNGKREIYTKYFPISTKIRNISQNVRNSI
jgi:hypothetical protein